MNKPKKANTRASAALAIKAVIVQKQSLDTALAQYEQGLSTQDISLLKALCYGVLRQFETLSQQITPLLAKPMRNKDYDVYALLLIGVYQLHALRMPDYAAIDSVVEASKHLQKKWATGIINALLRRIQKTPQTHFSAQTRSEHPAWLFHRIQQAWPTQAEKIFEANNQQGPLCLRVNQQKISRDEYIKRLSDVGFHARSGLLSAQAIYIDNPPDDIFTLPLFAEGFSSVQDESAQYAAIALAATDNSRILDACAAPGGKTCHILESVNDASLLALDIEPKRLERVEENLQRLQLSAQTKVADILAVDAWWDGQPFDYILCDAPCSATGVIRRHPDIKQLRTAEDIENLATLQLQILHTLWPLLKTGGCLLYATCSIMPEENSRVIEAFCQQQTHCQVEKLPISDSLFAHESDFGLQIFPQIHGQDGFFLARLIKTGAQ